MPSRSERPQVAVLISGAGSLLRTLIEASQDGRLAVELVGVGADRVASGLIWAERAGLPNFVLPLTDATDRAEWDRVLTRRVAQWEPDLVVSAGFMRLFGPAFLARFAGRCLNTHPSLLPSFPGRGAVRQALAAGVKLTGCTVFQVDAGVDTGPIVAQAGVPVRPGDDEATLHERIKIEERQLLVDVIREWPFGRRGDYD
ncbi:MAG: phosphoribosylglycinamide formyltransferase [Propionibacteriaceae bacterium]|nr:phosphoribosylglycinamide formyltransferase [Propionibacteriaceae bacterium]